jgi:hypothetical protein
MTKKLATFLNYKIFSESLFSDKQKINYLNSLCEIAELEFLSRLPRGVTDKEINSFIQKAGKQYGIVYDADYLAMRWKKLFGSEIFRSAAEANKVIFSRDKNKCQYCNRNEKLEVHHVIPKDKKKYRGVDSYYNLVLACERCNKEILNNIVLPQNWWDLHSDSRYS